MNTTERLDVAGAGGGETVNGSASSPFTNLAA
jgi:hypothetical protein